MRLFLFTILCSLFAFASFSQEPNNKSQPNYFDKNHQYIKKLEEHYDVHFFFKKIWLENQKLKQVPVQGKLNSILDEIFEETFIKYHIYENNYVILTYHDKLDLSTKQSSSPDINYLDTEEELLDRETLKEEESKIHKIGNPGGKKEKLTLSGRIIDISTGDPIEGVSVVTQDGKRGTVSGTDGYYNLKLPKGYHVVHYQHIGMEQTIRKLRIYSNGSINVPLIPKVEELEQVMVITEDKRKEKQLSGFEKMDMQDFEALPSFLGETDIIKHSLLLPGIQSVREGDASFSVRGGKGDQNLILIDDMHSYSVSHFFGFFPGINPNTISDANLYKSAIPIEYGNRLASVYEINTKKGNFEKFSMQGGVNPVSANVALEGPIVKDKMSFVMGGRSTYSDYVLEKINVSELNGSSASFHDYQAKLDYKINNKSLGSIFYYKSNDDFTLHADTSYSISNELASAKYRAQLNDKTDLDISAGFTKYRNENNITSSDSKARKENQKITDIKIKSLLNYEYSNNHEFTGGFNLLYTKIKPWELHKGDEASIINPISINEEKALTTSFFLGDNMILFPRFSLNIGLRYTAYTFLGPNERHLYTDNVITENNIKGIQNYSNNEIVYFDSGLGFRLNGSYNLGSEQYLNFSFNRNKQYIHMLTNSQSANPLDSWKLSDNNTPPQIGYQASLGYNKTFISDHIDVSMDLYYKKMKNIKDFIRGSEFKFNQHPETEIVNALGKSYGAEIMLKKEKGRISGWLSYTYSRVFNKSSSSIVEKNINNGDYYPANNDKPHNLSAVINFKPSRKLELSNIFNFSSGVPITLPVAKMKVDNSYSIVYSDRNEFRMPNYFRWDISLTYKGNLKRDKLLSGSWTFSIYNLTGRMNPHSIYFLQQDNNIKGYKLSIIGTQIPTITYKFKF